MSWREPRSVPITVDEWLNVYKIEPAPPQSWPTLLWTHAWDQNKPIVTKLKTPQSILAKIPNAPAEYRAMKGFGDQFKRFAITQLLVRNDYINILRRILTFFSFLDDGLDDLVEKADFPTAPFPSEASIDDIQCELEKTNVSNMGQPALVVTGSPGNGKSIFAHLMVGLRLRAKLDTLFQDNENHAYLFTQHGAHKITHNQINDAIIAQELGSLLSESGGWCIIDSNEDLAAPSMFARNTFIPIIQTPSPRPDRLKWAKKFPSTQTFIISPFTLLEALIAREFQISCHGRSIPSEDQLIDWFRKFVPSARVAFMYAADQASYELNLRMRLQTLGTIGTLRDLALRAQAFFDPNPDSISHEVFIFIPNETYKHLHSTIATPHLTDIILSVMAITTYTKRLETYKLCLESAPLARAASHLLDLFVRERLPFGGVWPLKKLISTKKQNKSHWVLDTVQSSLSSYLVIGGQNLIVSSTTAPIITALNYSTFPYSCYTLSPQDLKSQTVYLPNAGNNAIFDVFYYAANTAVLFQSTANKVSHGVNKGGLELMTRLGIKNIIYVGVVPPGHQPSFTIDQKLEETFSENIQERYILEFDPERENIT